MKTAIETWTAYEDFSGVESLIRVDGVLFSCHFTSEVKVRTVQNKACSIVAGKRRTRVAEWLFGKALEERTTPEYRAATVALYQN